MLQWGFWKKEKFARLILWLMGIAGIVGIVFLIFETDGLGEGIFNFGLS